jgi:hypothetical protein
MKSAMITLMRRRWTFFGWMLAWGERATVSLLRSCKFAFAETTDVNFTVQVI